jgi:hypothetical protein
MSENPVHYELCSSISTVAQAAEQLSSRVSCRGRKGLSGWEFRKQMNFIDANLVKPLRGGNIASEVGMSPGHFAPAFSISRFRSRLASPGNSSVLRF